MEFHSNLTTDWRDSSTADYNEEWWARSRDDILERIRTGRLSVLPTPPRILEEAMAIVTVGTRDYGRAVRSWDAVHMLLANRWSFQEGQPVDIITSDKHFAFASDFPGFSSNITVLNLDVLAKTGEGADSN